MEPLTAADLPTTPPNLPEKPKEAYRDKLARITSRPKFDEEVYHHIANGGSLLSLSDNLSLNYSDLHAWLMADNARLNMLGRAHECRISWIKDRLLDELRHIALLDLRQAFTADGRVKKPSDWPESVARALSSFEVEEIFQGSGTDREWIGYTKKVKFNGKIEALKLIGQEFGLFVQKHTVKVEKSIEEMVAGSFDPADAVDVTPEQVTPPDVGESSNMEESNERKES